MTELIRAVDKTIVAWSEIIRINQRNTSMDKTYKYIESLISLLTQRNTLATHTDSAEENTAKIGKTNQEPQRAKKEKPIDDDDLPPLKGTCFGVVGENVKRLRKKLGMTREEVAKAVEIDIIANGNIKDFEFNEGRLRLIEDGYSPACVDIEKSLAKVLGCDWAELRKVHPREGV